jgi:hypothetical protein
MVNHGGMNGAEPPAPEIDENVEPRLGCHRDDVAIAVVVDVGRREADDRLRQPEPLGLDRVREQHAENVRLRPPDHLVANAVAVEVSLERLGAGGDREQDQKEGGEQRKAAQRPAGTHASVRGRPASRSIDRAMAPVRSHPALGVHRITTAQWLTARAMRERDVRSASWAAGRAAHRLLGNGLNGQVDFHVVANEKSPGFEGGVPEEAIVLPVDAQLRLEPDA